MKVLIVTREITPGREYGGRFSVAGKKYQFSITYPFIEANGALPGVTVVRAPELSIYDGGKELNGTVRSHIRACIDLSVLALSKTQLRNGFLGRMYAGSYEIPDA